MNKQDALKQIEEQRDMILELHGWGVFGYIKGIINQLDEPQKIELPKVDFKKSQKVKVPPSVAKKIGYFKKTDEWGLLQVMDYLFRDKEIKKWLEDKNNQETVARAWLDGYEVEEEKRYLVKVKGMSEENTYLTFRFGRTWMLSNFEECEEFRLHHTRKELENANFGWVFDCPGIEIEEVEE